MTYYTTQQVCALSKRSERTIRHHVKSGWLKPEPKRPGVRGSRFASNVVKKWAAFHFGLQIK